MTWDEYELALITEITRYARIVVAQARANPACIPDIARTSIELYCVVPRTGGELPTPVPDGTLN